MSKDIKCIMSFDESTNTLTLQSKSGCILMMLKVPEGCNGTFTRIDENHDCDNYWIGVKPSDSTVFEDKLFDRKSSLVINNCDYSIVRK